MDSQTVFFLISLVLTFCLVSGIVSSLFLVPTKELLRGKRFFCRDKVDLFKRYIKIEKAYKKGELDSFEWKRKREAFLLEYKEISK